MTTEDSIRKIATLLERITEALVDIETLRARLTLIEQRQQKHEQLIDMLITRIDIQGDMIGATLKDIAKLKSVITKGD